MANDDVLKTFGLLPEPKRRGPAFFVSLIINGFIITLAVLISLAHLHDVRKRRAEAVALTFPVSKPPEIVKPKIPQIKIVPPPPQIAKLEAPKITLPKPEIEPPKPVEIKPLPTPMPVVTPAPPKMIAPPPQPKVGLFSSPKPTDVANNKTAPSTHVGGFGDPLGAKPNANSKTSQVATLGSFGNAPGQNDTGAGAARKGAVSGTSFGSGVANGVPGGHDHGTVASAGFQNGVIGGTGKPGGHGTVQSVGFAQAAAAPPPAPKQVEIASVQPPKVLNHPSPQYTSDARQARIEGTVVLKVRFTASGRVEVLGVVQGLGHGLDEAAMRVVQQTQFTPATQNGQAVDFTTTYRVAFQLA